MVYSYDEELANEISHELSHKNRVRSVHGSTFSFKSDKYKPVEECACLNNLDNKNNENNDENSSCVRFWRKKYQCIILYMMTLIMLSIAFVTVLNYIDEDVVKQISKILFQFLSSNLNLNQNTTNSLCSFNNSQEI